MFYCTYCASGTSLVDEIPPTPFSQWIMPKARRVRTGVHSIEQFRTINASGFTVYILPSIIQIKKVSCNFDNRVCRRNQENSRAEEWNLFEASSPVKKKVS